jgi:DNA-binding response OmpR family regulator
MKGLDRMGFCILVVDDEPLFLKLIEANLLTEGYKVLKAASGMEAIQKVIDLQPDLVLLDTMMPELDGFEVLTRLREFTSLPVIIVTARGGENDRVRGLDLGADDYIVKPFSTIELLARVRAVLRRTDFGLPLRSPAIFIHGNLKIDFARAEVFKDDRIVYLSATEYRLLLQFSHDVGKVLTLEKLLVDVWGMEYREDREILWVSISRLRQKLENDPRNPEHIITKPGEGYLMPLLA